MVVRGVYKLILVILANIDLVAHADKKQYSPKIFGKTMSLASRQKEN